MDKHRASGKFQMQGRNLWDAGKGAGHMDYRNIIRVCRDVTIKAKAHLQLGLSNDMKDNKQGFYKCISSKN